MFATNSPTSVQTLRKGILALLCAGALAVAGLVAPPVAVAADTPYLDDSFGERGRAVVDLGGGQGMGAVAVDVDLQGRTVTVGLLHNPSTLSVLRVIRLLPAGELDPAFGEGGVATFPSVPDVSDVEVQDDGRILVLSSTQLMRLDERGAVDEAFGTAGTAVPGGSSDNIFSCFDVAADGTIVAAGTALTWNGSIFWRKATAWRYTADGSLASSFDQVPMNPEDPYDGWAAQTVTIDGAGRVIIAGSTRGGGRLLRFLPEGGLDTSFGVGGSVHLPSTGLEVAAYSDGTVAVFHQRLSAYDADGTFLADLASPGDLHIVSLQIDGTNRLLAAGNRTLQGATAFAIFRLRADRTVDGTFGTEGAVMSAFPQGDAYMADAALAPDGDLVATGWINSFGMDPLKPEPSGPYGWTRYDLGRGPAFGYPAQRNDFNGDGRTDVLARDRGGVLWLYPGNGQGAFLTRTRVGGGWNVMTAIAGAADLNTDGKADALARDSSGVLWFYPGNGNGNGAFLTRTRVGGGWNVMTALAATEDFDDDGKADLLARDKGGVLWSYRGNGKGAFPTRAMVSSGWNPMTAITPAEDRMRDGRGDLLARDRNGVLWFYPGDGTGGLRHPLRVGAGWNAMTAIVGTGDLNSQRRQNSGWVGDGTADMVARDSSGVLWFYPGDGRGGFGPRTRIGAGWNVMTSVS